MATSPAHTPDQFAMLVGEVIDDQALRLTGRSLGTVASYRCAQEVLAVALPMIADAIDAACVEVRDQVMERGGSALAWVCETRDTVARFLDRLATDIANTERTDR